VTAKTVLAGYADQARCGDQERDALRAQVRRLKADNRKLVRLAALVTCLRREVSRLKTALELALVPVTPLASVVPVAPVQRVRTKDRENQVIAELRREVADLRKHVGRLTGENDALQARVAWLEEAVGRAESAVPRRPDLTWADLVKAAAES
jgi:hypothetical protein